MTRRRSRLRPSEGRDDRRPAWLAASLARSLVRAAALALALALALWPGVLPGPAVAAPTAAACVAPARPGGGFDLTCRLLAEALDGAPQETRLFAAPVARDFLPGGVGAVAFNEVVNRRRAENGTLVAFSEGSIDALARGGFGDHGLGDVRWLAALGLDHGAMVVRDDAPWSDLRGFLAALAAAPHRVAIGGGGTLGGRDWLRAAMTAKAAGLGAGEIRFVGFDGGGSCSEGLIGGFVQACVNDVADSQALIDAGRPLRLLAVYAPARLGGELAGVPTAREQGVALDWPVMRGVYMGPDVSDADFDWWRQRMDALLATPGYARLLERYHLSPLPLTGPALVAELERMVTLARARGPDTGLP
ncbi:tripartite tricarboxylate transporter substrate-binding protein [Frigidibacter sp. MR17.14]|uniref:Bug family tripartite tricarboxylate transporter substrate binding protein n=1 Tax=Frigidibacter sp. MR17.14 TaxID=3126509 RepID=UPI003012BF34